MKEKKTIRNHNVVEIKSTNNIMISQIRNIQIKSHKCNWYICKGHW